GVTASDESLVVVWSTPGDGGAPIIGYEVSLDGGATWPHVFGASTTTATILSLDNGSTYDVAVRARNAVGAGEASETVEATPHTTPAAPVAVTAVPANRELDITFGPPPFDGGSPITGYEVSLDGGAT